MAIACMRASEDNVCSSMCMKHLKVSIKHCNVHTDPDLWCPECIGIFVIDHDSSDTMTLQSRRLDVPSFSFTQLELHGLCPPGHHSITMFLWYTHRAIRGITDTAEAPDTGDHIVLLSAHLPDKQIRGGPVRMPAIACYEWVQDMS